MAHQRTMEVPIRGMDCAECASHVQHAIAVLPGVKSVEVFLTSEKAVIQLDSTPVELPAIRTAVEGAGYSVPADTEEQAPAATLAGFQRSILTLFGVAFGGVLFIVIVGEWLGLFETISDRIPWPIGLAAVIIGGYPIFRNVIRAALKRQVISHTLMSVGVLAALAVGQWATAAVVVFFMRVGEYAERFTTERSRRVVKDLMAMAPQKARIEQNGAEREVPVSEVRVGDVVIVRPGEQIPVDGEVISGQATIDQAAITGESMPVEVGAGSKVFAASFASLGSLRVRTTQIGTETTFGKVIRLVEEAEAHRADVQRIADKFSAYYLPVVAAIAVITFLLRRDPLATAAVLVVACSCSFALATPIAMLASIGAGAKRGVLIKGGKYIELLDKADIVLVDKTGTLTLGKPQIAEVVPLNGISTEEALSLAASAERYSEHPLAKAVLSFAQTRNLPLYEPEQFEAVPGSGVRAQVNGMQVSVGNRRLVPEAAELPVVNELVARGQTPMFITRNGTLVAALAAADTMRPEIVDAFAQLRTMGIQKIEILTGDTDTTAQALASQLGISYRANLLPEDKIAIVKEYQAQGHRVIMVGDGVNDAPALAQADVGIAMGAAGTDVAIEAAHVTLMRDDWMLVPEALAIARRTMRVVKMNIGFTALYNVIGLTLAAFGLLPPILAAAAQSLPDLGILGNSARLLRSRNVTADIDKTTKKVG